MSELRLTRIDALLLPDHVRLLPSDKCYFLREYTSGKVGYQHSKTNPLISNLKKPMDRKSDPQYDDRMVQILRLMGGQRAVDIRELIQQRESAAASHLSDETRDPARIQANFLIDETLTDPPPTHVALFDDIITTGAHYRAAHALLSERFEGVSVLGIFIARRVFPDREIQT